MRASSCACADWRLARTLPNRSISQEASSPPLRVVDRLDTVVSPAAVADLARVTDALPVRAGHASAPLDTSVARALLICATALASDGLSASARRISSATAGSLNRLHQSTRLVTLAPCGRSACHWVAIAVCGAWYGGCRRRRSAPGRRQVPPAASADAGIVSIRPMHAPRPTLGRWKPLSGSHRPVRYGWVKLRKIAAEPLPDAVSGAPYCCHDRS